MFFIFKRRRNKSSSFRKSDRRRNKRKKEIYEISEEILKDKAIKSIGNTFEVIVDEKLENVYLGRTKKDAPEVDCCVFFTAKKPLEIGEIVEVEIKGIEKNSNLFGILKQDGALV